MLQVIQILLKAKLLVTSDDESELGPTSTINLFTGYKKLVLFLFVNVHLVLNIN